jgi:hypothetical protein
MFDTLRAGLTFRGKNIATTAPAPSELHSAARKPNAADVAESSDRLSKDPRGIFKSSWALPALGSACLPHVP